MVAAEYAETNLNKFRLRAVELAKCGLTDLMKCNLLIGLIDQNMTGACSVKLEIMFDWKMCPRNEEERCRETAQIAVLTCPLYSP